jgi:hypothetical protein
MDTKKWLRSHVLDNILHVESARANACLIHEEESFQWAKEVLGLHERFGCSVMMIDLADVDYVSWPIISALEHLAVLLHDDKGILVVGGVRPHVLAIFLALAPSLDATNDPPALPAAVPSLQTAFAA